jgi:hypothetical protein
MECTQFDAADSAAAFLMVARSSMDDFRMKQDWIKKWHKSK